MQGRGMAADNQPAHPEKSIRHFVKTRSDFVRTRSDLNFSRSYLVFPRRHLVSPQSIHLSPAPRKITRPTHPVQIKSVYLPMNPNAGATTVAERRDSIYQERRLLALCPWLLGTSQTPNIQSTNIATVDAHWVCYMPARGAPQRAPRGSFTYIHIGVGFCVARSGCMGNAKASKSGTATIQTPALFSYICHHPFKTFPPRGVWRKQQENYYENRYRKLEVSVH